MLCGDETIQVFRCNVRTNSAISVEIKAIAPKWFIIQHRIWNDVIIGAVWFIRWVYNGIILDKTIQSR